MLRGGAVLARGPGFAVAADLRKPPLRELGLARQRLRLGAHLGEMDAVGLDLAAHFGELRLDVGGAAQFGERAFGVGYAPRSASSRLADEPGLRLGQRRQPRGVAAGLALGVGVLAERGLRRALQLAPVGAGIGFGFGGGAHLGFGGFAPTARLVSTSRAHGSSNSASMSARRFLPARRRAAPVGALAATEKPSQRQRSPSLETSRWPGLSSSQEPRRVGAADHADLRDAARTAPPAPSRDSRSGSTPSGSCGSSGSIAAPAQRMGEEGSTGASRSSPSAAPSAAS